MKMRFTAPVGVPIILLLLSGMTILFAAVQAVQIPLGALPEDSIRLAAAPISHFSHVVAGVAFGIIGPLQFGRVLAKRYGRAHRVLGRVFVVAGAFLSLSSLTLLWQFPDTHHVLVNGRRLVFGIGLGVALVMAMVAVKARDFQRHRDWMIRAYALGMGATLVSVVFLPILIITGVPPMGLWSDIVFIGSWAACVVFAQALIMWMNKGARA